MKERPILFSGPMIQGILREPDDPLCKVETRRVCKDAANEVGEWAGSVHPTGSGRSWISWWPSATAEETARLYPGDVGFRCPYGVPGDRLWVKETWLASATDDDGEDVLIGYRADDSDAWRTITGELIGIDEREAWCDRWVNRRGAGAWQPSIYMPRWASRLTLNVLAVRVERLHDIDDAGARHEGVADREAYRALWEDINGAGSWDVNPWVWVVGFRRVTS